MDKKTVKILIVAKTYPYPSSKYREIVCTAGVMEDGSWIRLYPIDYRYRNYSQWYKKYQWVEVDVIKYKHDRRIETHKPISELRLLNIVNDWTERKHIILKGGTRTACWLAKQNHENISLSIIKPRKIIDFIWEDDAKEWESWQTQKMSQLGLFDANKPKPLEKIPYKFSYEYLCEDDQCQKHKMIIADWEINALYRNMKSKYDEKTALKKVKEKFIDDLWRKRDLYFILGTTSRFYTWIIIGVFYPPKLLF